MRRLDVAFGAWFLGRMDYDGTGVVIGRESADNTPGPALRISSLETGDALELNESGPPSLIR